MTINAWGSDDPAQVAKGGSGRASATAYAVICGGTTTTTAHQSIASVGTSGHVLTSNGAGALPTFQATQAAGSWEYVSTTTISSDATIDFTALSGSGARFVWYNVLPATDNTDLYITVSNDAGSTWESTNYMYSSATVYDAGTAQDTGSTSAAQWSLTASAASIGNDTNEYGSSGFLEVYGLNDASNPAWIIWQATAMRSGNGGPFVVSGAGVSAERASGGSHLDIDSIRFAFSSGNLASGTIVQYQMVTS